MLLLAPPSRRSNDVAISLRAPAGDPNAAAVVVEAALGSSCPDDKAERVRSAILHSGRYDCRVSYAVVMPCTRRYMRLALGEVGGEMIVLDDDGAVVPEDSRPDTSVFGSLRWVHRPTRSASRPGRR